MPTVSRDLPDRPHLDVPKREARELLTAFRASDPDALDRVRTRHPKFKGKPAEAGTPYPERAFRLSDAQMVIAKEYGYSNWAQLKEKISSASLTDLLDTAIRADDRDMVIRVLKANPQLLHVPVWSGNWGPPMSHAANIGRLELIKAIAELGARDYQHAFDRALLQGKLDCARWLHEHGGKLAPGIIMGTCETLNAAGFRFLDELQAPFENEKGDRMAPLAMVLETYCRNPSGKHEILDLIEKRGCELPDTPIMALHRGNAERMKEFLRHAPDLINRRFAYREIYPPELGCADDGRSGLHGTPIDGTTLLQLAIEFDEREIFELLLAHGADVNARATVDANGFGGHTPLFNAVINCSVSCRRQRDDSIVKALLSRGAAPGIRASIRKFLDWRATPEWYEAHNVTPAEWGRDFPERNWVNTEALRLLDGNN